MSAVILIDFLSPEYSSVMVKGASFIEGLFCGTVYLLVLLGLRQCRHSKIVILIPDILFCCTLFLFCFVLVFVCIANLLVVSCNVFCCILM